MAEQTGINWRDSMNGIARFLRRLLCRHTRGTLIGIEYDGTSVFRCERCGAILRRGLAP